MKPRRFFQIAGLAAAALFPLLLDISPAHATEDAPNQAACGSTAKTAIEAAEKALASKNATAQTQALGCLLQAVKMLNADQAIVTRGANTMLHPPQLSGGPGAKSK